VLEVDRIRNQGNRGGGHIGQKIRQVTVTGSGTTRRQRRKPLSQQDTDAGPQNPVRQAATFGQ
jgi:hypothetical protein